MKGMTLMKIVAENFRKGRSSYVEVIGLSDHLNLLTKETAHCPWMKCGGFDGDYNAPGNSLQAGKEMRGKEKRGTSSRGKEKMVRRFHPYIKP